MVTRTIVTNWIWTCLEVVLWGDYNFGLSGSSSPVSRITKHKSAEVAWSSRNNQASDKLVQVSRRDQDQPRQDTRSSLSCLSQWSKDQWNEDWRPMKHCKANYASALSLSIEYYLCSFQTSHALPWFLPQQHHMNLHHMTYPETSTSQDDIF